MVIAVVELFTHTVFILKMRKEKKVIKTFNERKIKMCFSVCIFTQLSSRLSIDVQSEQHLA